MTPLSESLDQQALRELGELKCSGCGNAKQRGRTFCVACYKRLPANLRSALYKSFGNGYTQAWDESRDWLRDNQ